MTGNHPPSELALELAAAGEAPAYPLAPDDVARVEALARENAAFLEANDPAAFARRVSARVDELERRSAHRRFALLVPAVVAAALAVWVLPLEPATEARESLAVDVRAKGDLRAKGEGPRLAVARITEGGYERLAEGTAVHAGDVVQLQVDGVPPGADVVVVSIDGRGAVTLHYPKAPGEQLGEGGTLPTSFQLDDAPRFERFFLVAGPRLDPDHIAAAAARVARGDDPEHAPLPVEEAALQRSFLVHKQSLP